jgi:polar amino acid transport system substrate-binding protein
MKRLYTWRMLQAAAVVLALIFAAGAQVSLAPTGTLRAAFLATNPVQGRIDARTGEVTGPAGDLTRELARRLGATPRMVPADDAAAVIELVRTGSVDIGFLAFETARASQVAFSIPYLLMGSAYLVRSDSSLTTSAEVDRPGVVIGTVTGQSQEVHVTEHARNAVISRLPAMPASAVIADMVRSGQVQAFAANRQRMAEIAAGFPGLRVLADNFMMNGQAIAVPLGDPAKVAELNRFLTDMLRSGFVAASIARGGTAGVEAAPLPR